MKTHTHAHAAVLILALTASTPAARPVVQTPAARQVAPEATSGAMKLILLKPSIRFEDVRTTFAIEPSDEAEYQDVLLTAARRAVGSTVTVLDVDKLEPRILEACRRFDTLASRLARGDVNDEATEDFARLAAIDERYAVLVQFLRVKTGPGRSWNSFTGAIASSMASTLMQAALVSGKTGRVIWKGEQLVRNKALKPTNAAFNKELVLLFRDFDIN